MTKELTIDVSDYLKESEIKELVSEQVKYEVSKFFKDESNAQRLLSNLSYQIIFDEIDKIIPNSRELVISKTQEVLNDIKSFSVFRDGSYGGSKSLAYQMMEEAVRNNRNLLNDKVKEVITNRDYSKEIWEKFEELGETFISNIYEITRLGKENKKQI